MKGTGTPGDASPRLVTNVQADPEAPLTEGEHIGFDPRLATEARAELRAWAGYRETPLADLKGLAERLGVQSVLAKYEGERTELRSFKALGGAYALSVLLRQRLGLAGLSASVEGLETGRYSAHIAQLTAVCASDGNHGRSLAWGAKRFGCRCVIYLPTSVSDFRAKAIEAYGARVVRVNGNYDDAVRLAALDASQNDWLLVADTASAEYRETPRLVMAGYSLLIDEAIAQMGGEKPTHVFVQVGCGGLAGVVSGYLRWRFARRPMVIAVEPVAAACLSRTVEAGALATVPGEHPTIMGGLACGEVSFIAWEVLRKGLDHVLEIPDGFANEAVRSLANGSLGEHLVAGPSGAAGVGALLALIGNEELKQQLEIDRHSRLLLIVTEGATDPDEYAAIIHKGEASAP